MNPDQKDKLIGALQDAIPPGHVFVLLVRPVGSGSQAQTETFDNVPDKRLLADWLRHCARGYERKK